MPLFSHDLLELEIKKRFTFKNISRIELYNKKRHLLVDKIDVGLDVDKIGLDTPYRSRTIKRSLIYKFKNKIIIKPHTNKLIQGKKYILKIFNKHNYPILVKVIEIEKTTDNTSIKRLLVSKNDKNGFKTIQSCFNYVMKHNLNGSKIYIDKGNYFEPIYLNGLKNLSLIGISDKVNIIFNNSEKINSGSELRTLFLLDDCTNIKIRNLKFYNVHIRTGFRDQAETLFYKCTKDTQKIKIYNCLFKSEQDTLQLQGKSVIAKSSVLGNVDFIWGSPAYSVFINCHIVTIGDSKYKKGFGNGGYIVQCRCKRKKDLGFIFLLCNLDYKKGSTGVNVSNKSTYLARCCKNSSVYQYVRYILCKKNSHISPILWLYSNNKNLKTGFHFM